MEGAGELDVRVVDHDHVICLGRLQPADAASVAVVAAAVAVDHGVASDETMGLREGDLVAAKLRDRHRCGRVEGERRGVDRHEHLAGRIDGREQDGHAGNRVGPGCRQAERFVVCVVSGDDEVAPPRGEAADAGLTGLGEIDDLFAGCERVGVGEVDRVGLHRLGRGFKCSLPAEVEATENVGRTAARARQRHSPAGHGVVEACGQLDRARIDHDDEIRLAILQAADTRAISRTVDHAVTISEAVLAREADRIAGEGDGGCWIEWERRDRRPLVLLESRRHHHAAAGDDRRILDHRLHVASGAVVGRGGLEGAINHAVVDLDHVGIGRIARTADVVVGQHGPDPASALGAGDRQRNRPQRRRLGGRHQHVGGRGDRRSPNMGIDRVGDRVDHDRAGAAYRLLVASASPTSTSRSDADEQRRRRCHH